MSFKKGIIIMFNNSIFRLFVSFYLFIIFSSSIFSAEEEEENLNKSIVCLECPLDNLILVNQFKAYTLPEEIEVYLNDLRYIAGSFFSQNRYQKSAYYYTQIVVELGSNIIPDDWRNAAK